jgi:hypothetical protein
MVGAALTLMVLDRYDNRFTERVRTTVMDGVTPLLDIHHIAAGRQRRRGHGRGRRAGQSAQRE